MVAEITFRDLKYAAELRQGSNSECDKLSSLFTKKFHGLK